MRPAPAREARTLLGGVVLESDQYGRALEPGAETFLSYTGSALRRLLHDGRVMVPVALRCPCGSCIALVIRRPLGDLLLTAMGSGRAPGEHAVQALWLDEATHVPAAVCPCGRTSQGPGIRHVERIRRDVETALSTRSRVERLLHPPVFPARRTARTHLAA